MQPIIVVFDPWEINSISHEKDNLGTSKSFIHDYHDKDNLTFTRSFFKINVTRMT
jgi:hypothetical protein